MKEHSYFAHTFISVNTYNHGILKITIGNVKGILMKLNLYTISIIV